MYITCGDRGAIMQSPDDDEVVAALGLHLIGTLDTVGAGDSFLAGIAAALATRQATEDGLALGNFAAGVTVQKRLQTGTAAPDEIRALAADPDYIYNPELADNPRRANYLDRKSTRLNSSHIPLSRMPSSA